MADIFTKGDAEKLLEKKSLWFWGDSNMRGLYKDLIWLLEKNTLIDLNSLKGKLEGSFMNDVLVKGGALHRGRNFQEIRLYRNFKLEINIEFTFLTQCFSKMLEEKVKQIHSIKDMPDVIVINSCLWDIARWGPESVTKYKTNLMNLIKLLKTSLPSKTRVIWVTTPPVSNEPRGGFFIKQIEFLKHTLRFDVMEANTFVSREFILHGFDVLDIHYHLLLQIHRRRPDGIHWNPEAVRHITNLFLTHVCVSWNLPLPGNFKTPLLTKMQLEAQEGPICSSVKPTETQTSTKPSEDLKNVLKSVLPQNKKSRRRRKKRDHNGNVVGQPPPKIDFTKDVFDYDFKKKRFKMVGCGNC